MAGYDGRLLTERVQQLQVHGVADGEYPGLQVPPRPDVPAVVVDDVLVCLLL